MSLHYITYVIKDGMMSEWSMIFRSPVSGFDVLADQCYVTAHDFILLIEQSSLLQALAVSKKLYC